MIIVASCKKRWKSLRDTFIKYYRLEVQYKNGEIRKRPKNWPYYKEMFFLKAHVELFRLEESFEPYTKDGEMTDQERQFFDNQEDETKVEYEIRIAGEEYPQSASFRVKRDHLLESYEEQPEADVEYEVVDQDEKSISDEYSAHDVAASKELEEALEDSQVSDQAGSFQQQLPSKPLHIQNVCHVEEQPAPVRAPVDPDESYWASRFEAFKRLSRQQKAIVRMGIEKLLYEAEFESVGEPQIKRSRLT